ncbi:MAG: DUF1802 family protein [Myxococcales bacterium]
MGEPVGVAFKEWAAIVEALLDGRQLLVLRKGGIAEDGGGFAVEHRRFALLPTFFHQQAEGLVPEGRELLERAQQAAPRDGVRIAGLAEVCAAARVTSAEVLSALRPHHLYADGVLRERFERWREPGLVALLVRAYRLPAPVELPQDPAFTGCRSWATLPSPVPTDGATPALDDARFDAARRALEAVLGAKVRA